MSMEEHRMRSVVRRAAIGAIALSLLVSGAATASGSRQSAHGTSTAAGANVDWPQFGNTSDNTHFSPLAQINSSNVSQLGVAWTAAEGGHLVTFETDPVVVNGVMYYTTNADQVRAVDAATGKLLWQYTPKVNFYIALAGGGGGCRPTVASRWPMGRCICSPLTIS
jgi:glucose dehydrogenase